MRFKILISIDYNNTRLCILIKKVYFWKKEGNLYTSYLSRWEWLMALVHVDLKESNVLINNVHIKCDHKMNNETIHE